MVLLLPGGGGKVGIILQEAVFETVNRIKNETLKNKYFAIKNTLFHQMHSDGHSEWVTQNETSQFK